MFYIYENWFFIKCFYIKYVLKMVYLEFIQLIIILFLARKYQSESGLFGHPILCLSVVILFIPIASSFSFSVLPL